MEVLTKGKLTKTLDDAVVIFLETVETDSPAGANEGLSDVIKDIGIFLLQGKYSKCVDLLKSAQKKHPQEEIFK